MDQRSSDSSGALPAPDRVRYENFGGILSFTNPPFLAWVDRDFMRTIGYASSPLWENGQEYLSAPTEVHFAVTGRCSRGCAGCYMDSSSNGAEDLPLDKIKPLLQMLRDRGVFHVALGGGEALEREDFGEIVAFCRKIGLVPNLTTSGAPLGEREIEICRMLGQVNVSCDGVDAIYGVNGRQGSFEDAARALRKLIQAGIAAGINCVVSRKNFGHLHELIAFAGEAGVREIEFLKFKPSGRGRNGYAEFALTQEMIREFYPMIMGTRRPKSLELKIDCSFIPALLWHKPPLDELELCGVNGCDGGNQLLSVRSNGVFSGCSFIENPCCEPVADLERLWHDSPHLREFRGCAGAIAEPCRSCTYLSICKGGCRAVALFKDGNFSAPDPECPFVYDYRKENHEKK